VLNRLVTANARTLLALYAFADLVCLGAGMGVPIFCIALGVPAGWITGKRALAVSSDIGSALQSVMRASALTSLITFIPLLFIWGSCITWLFNPSRDLANFGIPLILYTPQASFIGWLVLMILISPILQGMVTLTAGVLVLQRENRRS
jgi:hypothetical protein